MREVVRKRSVAFQGRLERRHWRRSCAYSSWNASKPWEGAAPERSERRRRRTVLLPKVFKELGVERCSAFIAEPRSQYESLAGPLMPRCVTGEIATCTATLGNGVQQKSEAGLCFIGRDWCRAGFSSVRFTVNCFASRCPSPSRPFSGMDKPPVAMTECFCETTPREVSSVKRAVFVIVFGNALGIASQHSATFSARFPASVQSGGGIITKSCP